MFVVGRLEVVEEIVPVLLVVLPVLNVDPVEVIVVGSFDVVEEIVPVLLVVVAVPLVVDEVGRIELFVVVAVLMFSLLVVLYDVGEPVVELVVLV